jgi:hypothetical protein
LESRGQIEVTLRALRGTDWENKFIFKKVMTGIHLAAFFGAQKRVEVLLQRVFKMDCKDSTSQTPLS